MTLRRRGGMVCCGRPVVGERCGALQVVDGVKGIIAAAGRLAFFNSEQYQQELFKRV